MLIKIKKIFSLDREISIMVLSFLLGFFIADYMHYIDEKKTLNYSITLAKQTCKNESKLNECLNYLEIAKSSCYSMYPPIIEEEQCKLLDNIISGIKTKENLEFPGYHEVKYDQN